MDSLRRTSSSPRDYFQEQTDEREFLYTNAIGHDTGPRPGVFGLVHLWFENGETGEPEDAPLGRVRRALYYKPFSGDLKERPVGSTCHRTRNAG